jgi:hypothetical protein
MNAEEPLTLGGKRDAINVGACYVENALESGSKQIRYGKNWIKLRRLWNRGRS